MTTLNQCRGHERQHGCSSVISDCKKQTSRQMTPRVLRLCLQPTPARTDHMLRLATASGRREATPPAHQSDKPPKKLTRQPLHHCKKNSKKIRASHAFYKSTKCQFNPEKQAKNTKKPPRAAPSQHPEAPANLWKCIFQTFQDNSINKNSLLRLI